MGGRIGVQLVEVGNSHREVRVRKKLDRLSLCAVSEEDRNVPALGTLEQQRRELLGLGAGVAHDDTAWMQVVPKSSALPQKLRGEHDAKTGVGFTHALCEAHRHRGLDDDRRVGSPTRHVVNNLFDGRSVEMHCVRIIVGRGGNYDKGCSGISVLRIGSGPEVEIASPEEGLEFCIFMIGGRPALTNSAREPSTSRATTSLVLGKDDGIGQPHVAEANNSYLHSIILSVLGSC